jgi:hypothetical protein
MMRFHSVCFFIRGELGEMKKCRLALDRHLLVKIGDVMGDDGLVKVKPTDRASDRLSAIPTNERQSPPNPFQQKPFGVVDIGC